MKTLVIGLDGLDYHLLNEFLEDLPNLKSLINEGIFCNLESTLPNISPSAWTSFFTGKKPENHHIVDFVYREKQDLTDRGQAINSTLIKGESLWKILSEYKKKVIVFNVPMTYPVEEVNGIMIGGFPIPKGVENYTWPKKLREELKQKNWDFSDIATQSYSKTELDNFLKEIYERLEERTKATFFLMEKPWDFFMVHFMETDKASHEFLNFKYQKNVKKKYYEKYHDVIKDFYKKTDEKVGEILKKIDKENVNIFIVSDHGFSPIYNVVNLDTWLLKKGYLKLKKGLLIKFKKFIFNFLNFSLFFKLIPEKIKYILRKTEDKKYYSDKKSFLDFIYLFFEKIMNFLSLNKNDIDWESSEAFSYGNTGIGNILLLKKSEDIRERLKQDLKEFINTKVFSDIKEFDTPLMPDIMIYDKNFNTNVFNHPNLFLSSKIVEKNFLWPDRANHNLSGIFIARGPDIKKTELKNAKIIDLFPTILSLYGIKTMGIDGKLLDIFNKKIDIDETKISEKLKNKNEKIDDKDKKKMLQSLKRMGYIA